MTNAPNLKLRTLSDSATRALTELGQKQRRPCAAPERASALMGETAHLDQLLEEHDPIGVSLIESQIRVLAEDIVSRNDPAMWSRVPGSFLRVFKTEQMPAMAADLAKAENGLALALSTHGSGYVRETALDHVRSLKGPFALALVLRRLNDWVPQVRSAAARVVDRCLLDRPDTDPDCLVVVSGCLELLLSAREMGRLQVFERDIVGRLINAGGGVDELANSIFCGTSDRAARLLKKAIKNGMLGEQLATLARQGHHPAVRRLALKTALAGEFAWKENGRLQRTEYKSKLGKDDLAETSLRDRSAIVQRVALQYVLDNPGSRLNREDVYRLFLGSKHVCLADNAGFGLKRLAGGPEFSEGLVQQLRRAQIPPFWAARLLARYDRPRALAEIRPAYERQNDSANLTWLELLASLEDGPATETLLRIALENEDLNAARKASKALAGKRFILEFGRLSRVIRRGNGEFEGRGLRSLLDKCSTMDIARVIVCLFRFDPAQDLEPIWRMASRKRQTRAFHPSESEIKLLEYDLVGVPTDLRLNISKVFGVPNLAKE